MGRLSGKVAIVTGASKGIGAAIAKGLAAEDAEVVVNYASSKVGANVVVEQITASGGRDCLNPECCGPQHSSPLSPATETKSGCSRFFVVGWAPKRDKPWPKGKG